MYIIYCTPSCLIAFYIAAALSSYATKAVINHSQPSWRNLSQEDFTQVNSTPDTLNGKEDGLRVCTGKHSDYNVGDTFYPSCASDGNLHSPWTDGVTNGVRFSSGGGVKTAHKTGHAVLSGNHPKHPEVHNTSQPKQTLATPYRDRYSANFENEKNGLLVEPIKIHPPGGRYGLSLHEMELIPKCG